VLLPHWHVPRCAQDISLKTIEFLVCDWRGCLKVLETSSCSHPQTSTPHSFVTFLPLDPCSLLLLLNLGCLHPVAPLISYDVGFNPSTQCHYRRLIYYLYIHSYIFRSYDHHQAEKYITTLGLLNWQRIRCFIRSRITVIVYIMLRIFYVCRAVGKVLNTKMSARDRCLYP
jgi:hypothetical protein